MIRKYIQVLFLCIGLILYASNIQAQIKVTALKCELLTNPKGIDSPFPRMSWQIDSKKRAVMQLSYHILVSSSKENLDKEIGDLWDSGEVQSDQSAYITYAGKKLQSRNTCYWKVRSLTSKGQSNWSTPATWTMGLLQQDDWKAKWIGLDKSFEGDQIDSLHTRLSARYLRKEFSTTGKKVKKATAYISGLGLYEFYINGKKIGDQVLSPTPTDYTKSVKYNTFDVSKFISEGNNALGVTLGNGRFFSMRIKKKYYPNESNWLYNIKHFGFPKLLLQLEIEYQDGSSEYVCSDRSWKITPKGPIVSNSEFDGEEYDARREMPKWTETGFADNSWLNVEQVNAPAGKISAQINRNIKVMQRLKPRKITQPSKGTFILDMGQNMVGWIQMKVKGDAGKVVKLRFAETLKADGTLYMANIREAFVTDKYTLKGIGKETWHPRFSYHGFRYVEVTGYLGTPSLSDFEGQVIYDEMENTGTFSTSDSTINQIYHNAYWGIRSNYRGMPTDCPQRDERMGWLGDRATGCIGESFIFNNHDLYVKWMDDIQQTQRENGSLSDIAPNYWAAYNDNMTWPAAYLTVGNMIYQQYGDLAPIRAHYPSMKKWMDYMRKSFMKDGIMTRDTYGDWCMPPERLDMIFSEDPTRKTDGQLIGTSFYYYLAGLMERFAGLLDIPSDVQDFKNQRILVAEAFNKKYLNANAGNYANNTVTGNLLPLSFGMVPAEQRGKVFESLVSKTQGEFKSHVSVGLIGIQWLMRGLSENGRSDLALKIATNRDYPSWGYMREQGATTIWELWNGNTADPSMNSGNHVMLLGDLVIWYYQQLGGIKNAAQSAGFKQLEMKPEFIEGLSGVNATFNSIYGNITSKWERKGTGINWTVCIPANTTATLSLPESDPSKISEHGKPINKIKEIKFLGVANGRSIFQIGSGNYKFKMN